jgi:hypothetical protein
MHFFVGIMLVACGAIVGWAVTTLVNMGRSSTGVLRIDHSNPEKDLYKLELGDLDELSKKSHLILTIDHNADLSQE